MLPLYGGGDGHSIRPPRRNRVARMSEGLGDAERCTHKCLPYACTCCRCCRPSFLVNEGAIHSPANDNSRTNGVFVPSPVDRLAVVAMVLPSLENAPHLALYSSLLLFSIPWTFVLHSGVQLFSVLFYFNDFFFFFKCYFFVQDVYAVTRSDRAIGLIYQSINQPVHVVFCR